MKVHGKIETPVKLCLCIFTGGKQKDTIKELGQ